MCLSLPAGKVCGLNLNRLFFRSNGSQSAVEASLSETGGTRGQVETDVQAAQLRILEAILAEVRTQGPAMEAAFKELSRSFTASSRSMVSAVEEVSRACTEIRTLSESFRNANITPNAFCPVAKKAPFQVNQPFSFCVVLPYQL